MRLALYQPEIPQNTGTLLRTAACLGFGVDIIRPTGFPLSDRTLRRAGMDYLESVSYQVHNTYEDFFHKISGRLVLLSTQGSVAYWDHVYDPSDTLMLGRESDGVPQKIEDTIPWRVRIPMVEGMRSLNVAIAAGIVMGEMKRQIHQMRIE